MFLVDPQVSVILSTTPLLGGAPPPDLAAGVHYIPPPLYPSSSQRAEGALVHYSKCESLLKDLTLAKAKFLPPGEHTTQANNDFSY